MNNKQNGEIYSHESSNSSSNDEKATLQQSLYNINNWIYHSIENKSVLGKFLSKKSRIKCNPKSKFLYLDEKI